MPVSTRTTAAEVCLIIDTTEAHDVVEAFIGDANIWVTNRLVPACPQLTAADLKVIEKYLSAHLITLKDPRLTRARHDDVEESYQRDPKMTEYLKMAMALDPCGVIEEDFTDVDGVGRVKFRTGAGFDDNLDLPVTHA